MRLLTILGVLLIVLGICAIAVPSFTYFTTERAVDAGPLKIDWQKPHTIILNPIAGVAALVGGAVCLLAGRRTETA